MANEMFVANPAVSGNPGYGLQSKAFSANYLKALYDKVGAWKRLRNFTSDAAFGESVTIPSFPRITAVDVTQATGAFSYENTSIDGKLIPINKIKAVAYSVPEYMFTQSKVNIEMAFAEAAGDSINDSIDLELVKLISSLSTNSAGTLNADLDETKALAVMQKLVENRVSFANPDDFVWVLPASQFGPIHALKGYANSYRLVSPNTKSDGSADIQAAVDTLYGIAVHFRSDSQMTVTGGKIGGLFYRDSVGVAIQKAPTMRPPMPIPGTINTELLTHAHFGIAVVKDAVACKVLTK